MTRRPVCLITGTTHGIGTITARHLASDGYRVVMGCRDEPRANALQAELASRTGNPDIHVLHCDLSSMNSVRKAAARFRQRFEHLDLLVNNAGTMRTDFERSADGLELTFAANYLGPWLLTRLLLDSLVASSPARIVTVASAVHQRGRLEPSELQSESTQAFSGMAAYARSKLGNVMATLSQAERLTGTGVTANCLHPGVIGTNITSQTNLFLRLGMKLAAPFMLSPERGAKTSLFLARDAGLADISGQYFDQNQNITRPAASALDPDARQALWEWSSRFCGLPEWKP